MEMERIASDVPPNDGNFPSENAETNPKQSIKYAIVYWIETQKLNVMPLQRPERQAIRRADSNAKS